MREMVHGGEWASGSISMYGRIKSDGSKAVLTVSNPYLFITNLDNQSSLLVLAGCTATGYHPLIASSNVLCLEKQWLEQ